MKTYHSWLRDEEKALSSYVRRIGRRNLLTWLRDEEKALARREQREAAKRKARDVAKRKARKAAEHSRWLAFSC